MSSLRSPRRGGLALGTSASNAHTFAADRGGTYWPGYDLDVLTAVSGGMVKG